jgi:14-3-3 protein
MSDDSFRQIVEVIKSGSYLNFKEMSLFNRTFQSQAISKKIAWENADPAERTAEADDLLSFCNETLGMFNDYLVPAPKQYEQNLFFLNTKALCYKYISEVLTDDSQQEAINNAQQLYQEAYEATQFLPVVHPFVLRLILGFSVFSNDNKHDSNKASAIAKKGFEQAIQEMDALKEELYQESTSILKQINDYIVFLTSESESESE